MPPTMTFDEQTKVYHLPLFDQHKTPAEIVAFGEDISDELSIRILYDVPREKLAEGLLLVGDIDKINVVKDDEDEFPDNDWSMTLEEEAEADANIAKLIREWPEIQSRNREANIRAWMPPKLAALRS